MTERKTLWHFLGVAFLMGALFWLIDSLLLLYFFGPNLRSMIFDPPQTLWQALFFNISPQTLFTRLGFMAVCLFSGWGVARYVYVEGQLKTRFQSYVTHAPLAVFVADEATNILDVNPTACEMFGYTHEEFLSLAIIDIFEPKDAPLIRDYYAQLSLETAISIQTVPMRKDGSRFDMALEAVKLPNGNILGFGQDITERLSWEQALNATNAALQRSQAQYELIVEHVHDIVWQLDLNLIFTYVSPAVRSILGYEVDELVGTRISQYIPSDVLAEIPDYEIGDPSIRNAAQNPIEFVIQHKDGHLIDTETILTITYDENSGRWGYVGVTRDITRRKQDEAKLQAYADQLESMVDERTAQLRDAQEQMLRQERLATLGQIAGGISHELRNPLGVITNAIYYLRNVEEVSPEELDEYLDVIDEQARKSSKIIADLLDVSRTTSTDRAPTDFRELIGALVFQVPPPQSVKLHLDIPDDLPLAYIDRRQLEQVLGNLLTNAYQAMPDGGTLAISAEIEGDALRVDIQDSGTGIAPDILEKIFEPLFTTKASGIGMGLPICKRLVEANDGSISVQSTPGVGTTFTLHLPLYERVKSEAD